MARPLRIEFPGGIYHVTSRGDRQEPIFMEDRDRLLLLKILGQAMGRFDSTVIAYCLMGNHYHVVMRTRRPNLSQVMRHINGVYAQAFNRRHGVVGHLFQGRFKSIHVDRDAYFMEVCRYTELNPVRAGMVEGAVDWKWSSYRSHCGLAPAPDWLETLELHGHLLGRDARTKADRLEAARLYAGFVEAGRDQRLWERSLRQEIFLGDEPFIERVQRFLDETDLAVAEIPRIQRHSPNLDWLDARCSRDETLHRAYVHGGMTMSEIALAVGLSVSRVSRVIKRLEGKLSTSPSTTRYSVIRADSTPDRRHGEAKGKT
jgi:putative transposase